MPEPDRPSISLEDLDPDRLSNFRAKANPALKQILTKVQLIEGLTGSRFDYTPDQILTASSRIRQAVDNMETSLLREIERRSTAVDDFEI